MLTQRQAQVQRSPTERFALALRDYVDERLRNKGPLYDAAGEEEKALVRLEDAFNHAVEAKAAERVNAMLVAAGWFGNSND